MEEACDSHFMDHEAASSLTWGRACALAPERPFRKRRSSKEFLGVPLAGSAGDFLEIFHDHPSEQLMRLPALSTRACEGIAINVVGLTR
jgi:hypothetical protein